MRNLLLFLLILIGVYYLRRLLTGDRSEGAAPGQAPPDVAPPREAELVLPCAQCGLLVPASEGVEAQGLFFCSPEHQRLGPTRQ
ncbi:PP0621 family protein [Uliginosibacterium sp. H3]|uniref:PP0621 family protein n=1 Tax=Uliginosibacterium silvisoli TaxID=3114758 RepID=A0ABU6K716_9RHOO|nr:PP0621 family protein [Uliginosibacterium sp. H3]